MSALFTMPGIVALLVTVVGLYAVYLLFRYLYARDRRRQREMPFTVSFQVAQKHLPLICLIRGSEALFVVPLLLLILLIGFSVIFAESIRFLVVIVLSSFLVVGAWRIARERERFSRPGREIFRTFQEMKERFQRVNTNSVGNFAFIFAAFAAHDFYRLMPPAPAKIVPGFAGMLNRDFLWIVVFWSLWRFLKISLGRLLELNRSIPPSPTDDPDIPEFPQKSPLIPL